MSVRARPLPIGPFRPVCGTWIGVLLHQSYAETLCPDCLGADRDRELHAATTARLAAARDILLPIREGIHRSPCGAWVVDGHLCPTCVRLDQQVAS
jgi:hypothetical protein